MRKIALTTPLSERTRPVHFDEIIGQKEGIKALRAALCGPNPQHVLLYGSPGVGENCCGEINLGGSQEKSQFAF
ncbi:ATP-dependent protease La [Desulfosporosinus sp. I2]|nr:ATP-dependent protease La [Desulfosporosinus sp. I2]